VLAEWRIIRFTDGAEHTTTATVRLSGELDLAARHMLREHLAQLAEKQIERLVVDLAGVSYMDCGTAEILLDVARSTLPPGVKPVFRNPQPVVRRLLEISNLIGECTIEVSHRSALKAAPSRSSRRLIDGEVVNDKAAGLLGQRQV
jgi:anti-anti-sigma factor